MLLPALAEAGKGKLVRAAVDVVRGLIGRRRAKKRARRELQRLEAEKQRQLGELARQEQLTKAEIREAAEKEIKRAQAGKKKLLERMLGSPIAAYKLEEARAAALPAVLAAERDVAREFAARRAEVEAGFAQRKGDIERMKEEAKEMARARIKAGLLGVAGHLVKRRAKPVKEYFEAPFA